MSQKNYVATNVRFTLLSGGHVGALDTARLVYAPEKDLFTVHIVFPTGAAWTLSRPALTEGLMLGARDGLVEVEPHEDGVAITYLGTAAILCDHEDLLGFLRATEGLVRPGTEHLNDRFDAGLRTILESAR